MNLFDLVAEGAAAFSDAGLHFGHGTDNAEDEALFLALHGAGYDYATAERTLQAPLDAGQLARVRHLFDQRLRSRRPAAYLVGHTWFAGHEFVVDERVLVPRSPIAELIAARLQPWLVNPDPRRALDIGTGSGCIALALALEWPALTVDATDISAAALEVAALNRARHGLEDRVNLIECDLFPPHGGDYDLVVSNPPYVPASRAAELPAEYAAEPAGALYAGATGLDCVDRILSGAAARLAADGILVLEVGEIRELVAQRYADAGLVWVDLVRGGEGVCVVDRDSLEKLARA